MTTLFTIITTVAIFALACAAIAELIMLIAMKVSFGRRIRECERQIRIEQIDKEYKDRPTTAVVVKRREGLI